MFNVDSHFFRPPYGQIDARARVTLGMMGITTVLWDIDVQDWIYGANGDPNKQQLAAFKDQLDKGGSLAVAHYLYPSTVQQMDEMITYAKSKGKKFVRLDECLNYPKDLPSVYLTPVPSTIPPSTVAPSECLYNIHRGVCLCVCVCACMCVCGGCVF